MKFIIIFNSAIFLSVQARAQNAPMIAAPAPRERLAALVEYLAADYAGAVKNGEVIALSEYEEQLGLVREAKTLPVRLQPLAGHTGSALQRGLDALERDLMAKKNEAEVVADCRALRRLLIDDYGLTLLPPAPPSQARAQKLFAENCASCHGPDGHAGTAQGRLLKPEPVSFYQSERMKRISPALAFSAITFGVPNTAMAAFDTLPASDRWSLAFAVVAMRHRSENSQRGGELFARNRVQLAPTPSRLASLSDSEIETLLGSREVSDSTDIVAYLRTIAPFALAQGGTFAEARRLLAALSALDPSHSTQKQTARDLAISAYLEGIEPHEAWLRSRDRVLCQHIETAFLNLRQELDHGAEKSRLRESIGRIELLLDRADELAAPSARLPFFAALTIALREGFEWSLLIGALLAFVRKSGRGQDARFVHYGWIAALPAGALTWFAVGYALSGARRELSEGILTLFAAAMLLFVSHLVLGQRESRRWLGFLERKTRSGSSGRAPLFVLAFVAAYREAVEIVLFFRALVLDAPHHKMAVVLGAAFGIGILGAAIWAMTLLGRRLSPRPVMLVSSIVLTALAISLVGQGMRALQEGGFVPLHLLSGLPSLPAIGFFPSLEGLLLQIAVLGFAVLPSLLTRKSDRVVGNKAVRGT